MEVKNVLNLYIIFVYCRGMALTLAMMLGTIGSVAGNNMAGLLINNSCEVMFYLFGSLLICEYIYLV